MENIARDNLKALKGRHPEKFAGVNEIFRHIRRGNSIFIGTACGEPQYLIRSLTEYVESAAHSIFGAEIIHVWTLGVAPYADKKFEMNFRHNSFFISDSSRESINSGIADYTPVFVSEIPGLFRNGVIPVDVALIQLSPPDGNGAMSLGISVDIIRAAVECARIVVAQVNSFMPRTCGDTLVGADDVDYLVPYDEPLLVYDSEPPGPVAEKIGAYVARIIQDGDTIQVGYGSMPSAILSGLAGKKDLGVHTELLTDGIVGLIKSGAVTNTRKTLDRGVTVATFCMGTVPTYDFVNNNPAVEFRPIDYTNSLFTIGMQRNMTAINSVLQIDLTGQATAESIGTRFYSGVGGQADFMRGTALARGGKTILTLRSVTNNGEHSRIVPLLDCGASATIIRGDTHYVVTEHGTAYLHAKNIRERAMSLIAIADPKFRPWLIDEAKALGFIYRDQDFVPGKEGEYPDYLETIRETRTGIQLFLRPVKISDEEIIKDFFYSLSDKSIYTRFFANTQFMPHRLLQKYVVIDYSKELTILAFTDGKGRERLVGMGQYMIDEKSHTAAASFLVGDGDQNRGIGKTLLEYLTAIAKKEGLLGFSAHVLNENTPMMRLFESMDFEMEKTEEGGICSFRMGFYRRNG